MDFFSRSSNCAYLEAMLAFAPVVHLHGCGILLYAWVRNTTLCTALHIHVARQEFRTVFCAACFNLNKVAMLRMSNLP